MNYIYSFSKHMYNSNGFSLNFYTGFRGISFVAKSKLKCCFQGASLHREIENKHEFNMHNSEFSLKKPPNEKIYVLQKLELNPTMQFSETLI